MLKKSIFSLVIFFFFLSVSVVKADVCCPDDPDFNAGACTTGVLAPGCGGGGPAPGIPLDGGVSAFALGAVLYGVRRMRRKK